MQAVHQAGSLGEQAAEADSTPGWEDETSEGVESDPSNKAAKDPSGMGDGDGGPKGGDGAGKSDGADEDDGAILNRRPNLLSSWGQHQPGAVQEEEREPDENEVNDYGQSNQDTAKVPPARPARARARNDAGGASAYTGGAQSLQRNNASGAGVAAGGAQAPGRDGKGEVLQAAQSPGGSGRGTADRAKASTVRGGGGSARAATMLEDARDVVKAVNNENANVHVQLHLGDVSVPEQFRNRRLILHTYESMQVAQCSLSMRLSGEKLARPCSFTHTGVAVASWLWPLLTFAHAWVCSVVLAGLLAPGHI